MFFFFFFLPQFLSPWLHPAIVFVRWCFSFFNLKNNQKKPNRLLDWCSCLDCFSSCWCPGFLDHVNSFLSNVTVAGEIFWYLVGLAITPAYSFFFCCFWIRFGFLLAFSFSVKKQKNKNQKTNHRCTVERHMAAQQLPCPNLCRSEKWSAGKYRAITASFQAEIHPDNIWDVEHKWNVTKTVQSQLR